MIIAIVGKSNSGKTTFAKLIEKRLGLKNIITCTTRPMRDDELDGVHYHFLTKEEALIEIQNGKFLEYVEFKVCNGETWLYGTRFEDISMEGNQLIVVNPSGLKTLKKFFKDKVLAVYIKPTFMTRILRILKRDKGNYKEAFRRLLTDFKDFKDVEADIIIKDFEI